MGRVTRTATPAKIDASTSQFLDAARWMSAFAVVVSHACGLMLVSASQAAQRTIALRLFFSLENSGHVAVMIFFVVSGFLVGGQELVRILDGKHFDMSRYSIQRFSRIYVVLIPALFATVILDYAGQHYFNQSLLYTMPARQSVDSLQYAVADRDDATTLVGNFLMLQTIAVEPFGGNGPLWSLANEWWYYVVFGLFLISLSGNRGPVWRISSLAASLIILGLWPYTISWWFAIWLLGVALAVLNRIWSGVDFRQAFCFMLIGFAVSLYAMSWTPALVSRPSHVQWAMKLLVDSIAALSFAAPLLSAKNASWRILGRLHNRLAGFSYTLYLVHFPALIFLGAFVHDIFGVGSARPFGAASLTLVVAFVGTVSGYAWCFAYLTERRTLVVRDGLTRMVTRVRNLG